MRVSFDLDDTLFVNPDKFDVEDELRFPFNKRYKERLRKGTNKLINMIRDNDIEVGVYTTSFRSVKYIRRLFRHYGVKFDYIINGAIHFNEVQKGKNEPMPSKYPSKYRIDLHIDDDISVYQNGRTYGFKVFIIGDDDPEWVEKVWDEIQKRKKILDEKNV